MTIDLTTRKYVMKPVWTPLVVRPANFHVSRAHVMDIFLGKIISYIIWFQGSQGFRGLSRGPKVSKGVPRWVQSALLVVRPVNFRESQGHVTDIFQSNRITQSYGGLVGIQWAAVGVWRGQRGWGVWQGSYIALVGKPENCHESWDHLTSHHMFLRILKLQILFE